MKNFFPQWHCAVFTGIMHLMHIIMFLCSKKLCLFLISVEIILRAEAVEQAQAGDKCDFTGTLIVVPDVSQLSTPGTSTLTMFELSVKSTHHKPS